jgi:hypothetical protein
MSLSPETMLELMALADGELEGAARERIERLVAQSEEARRVVDAMRAPHVGLWLGEALQARAEAADGIADAVMARLESSSAGPGVRDGRGGEREEHGVVRLANAGGRRWSRTAVGVGTAALGGVLALAAGIAVYLRSAEQNSGERAPVASVVAPTAVRPPSPSQGVEVDEIDSPSRGVSVFEIPLGSAAAVAAGPSSPSSVVIWIDDDQGGK